MSNTFDQESASIIIAFIKSVDAEGTSNMLRGKPPGLRYYDVNTTLHRIKTSMYLITLDTIEKNRVVLQNMVNRWIC